MSTRALVFLDFDGVLNSYQFFRSKPQTWDMRDERNYFDPECVARVDDLLHRSDAAIVVSSSWRKGRDLPTLDRLLRRAGLRGDVVGLLPQRGPRGRGDLIAEWVARELPRAAVALDDLTDLGPAASIHVATDPEFGLQNPDVERALELLAKSMSSPT